MTNYDPMRIKWWEIVGLCAAAVFVGTFIVDWLL